MDCFTRFVELCPARDASAEAAAQALLGVFGRYGAPRFLRSDNGTQLTAQVITEFLQRVGTGRQLTIEYRPQSNRIVEKVNAEVLRHLRGIVMSRRVGANWSRHVPLVQRIVNATPHSAIGTTPARVLFGDAVRLDRRLLRGEEQHPQDGGQIAVEAYIRRLKRHKRRLLLPAIDTSARW